MFLLHIISNGEAEQENIPNTSTSALYDDICFLKCQLGFFSQLTSNFWLNVK